MRGNSYVIQRKQNLSQELKDALQVPVVLSIVSSSCLALTRVHFTSEDSLLCLLTNLTQISIHRLH